MITTVRCFVGFDLNNRTSMALSWYKLGKRRNRKKKELSGPKKKPPGIIRIAVDMAELELPDYAKLHIPNPDDLQHFDVLMTPNEGYWTDVTYTFKVSIPDSYPYRPPKIRLKEKIFHPSIDENGNISINILQRDWRPIISFQEVIHALYFLFTEIWKPYYDPGLVCFGYIRNQKCISTNKNIPDGIIKIIVVYYQEYEYDKSQARNMCHWMNRYANETLQKGQNFFRKMVRKSLKGEMIANVQYLKLL